MDQLGEWFWRALERLCEEVSVADCEADSAVDEVELSLVEDVAEGCLVTLSVGPVELQNGKVVVPDLHHVEQVLHSGVSGLEDNRKVPAVANRVVESQKQVVE